MLEMFLAAFATLFVIIDPIGCAPIFAGLTAGYAPHHATVTALRATAIAAIILFGFALAGEKLLAWLGIGLDAFRIAGGLMLFLIGQEMVFEKRTQRREERAEQVSHALPPVEDVSVFPMAMPMIAGPGSIATVMLLTARAGGGMPLLAVLGALAVVMVLVAAALVAAHPIMRLLGTRVEAVMTRILGVLLGALAVQYVIDGILGVLHATH